MKCIVYGNELSIYERVSANDDVIIDGHSKSMTITMKTKESRGKQDHSTVDATSTAKVKQNSNCPCAQAHAERVQFSIFFYTKEHIWARNLILLPLLVSLHSDFIH